MSMMLDFMRRRAKLILWGIIIIVVPSFIAFFGYSRVTGRKSRRSPSGLPDPVGSAFGKPISQQEFMYASMSVGTVLTVLYGPEAARRYFDMYDQIRSFIVLRREAQRRGLTVSDAELKARIKMIPTFKDDSGAFSMQRYQDVLGSIGISPRTFEQMFREYLKMDKLAQIVRDGVTVTDDEVWRRYVIDTQEADATFAVFRTADMMAEIEVTEDQIRQYHAEHGSDFMTDEERVVKYVYLPLSDVMPEVNVTDEQVERYYRGHISEFTKKAAMKASHILIAKPAPSQGQSEEDAEAATEQARKKAEEVLKRALAGEDFAALAKEFSDDPGSKDKGGELGWRDKGTLVPEFEEAAYAAEPGTVVDHVVETRFGFHIIKLEDKRDEQVTPLEKVASDIRKKLERQEAKRLASDALDQIVFEQADGQDFADLCDAYGYEIHRIGPFSLADAGKPRKEGADQQKTDEQAGDVASLPGAAAFAKAAFAIAEEGELSDPVDAGDGMYLIELEQIIPPREATLEEAHDRIALVLKRKLAAEEAKRRAEEFLSKLPQAESFEKLAEELGCDIVEADSVRRNGYVRGIGPAEKAGEALFRLQPGQVTDVVEIPNGYAVVRLNEIKPVDTAGFIKQRDSVARNIFSQKARRVYERWFAQLLDKADFELAPEVKERLRS